MFVVEIFQIASLHKLQWKDWGRSWILKIKVYIYYYIFYIYLYVCISVIQLQLLFEGKCQYKVENYFCIIQIWKIEQNSRPSLIPSTTRDSFFLSRSNCLEGRGGDLRATNRETSYNRLQTAESQLVVSKLWTTSTDMYSETQTASARHLQDRDSNVHAVPLHLLFLGQREQTRARQQLAASTAEIPWKEQISQNSFWGNSSAHTCSWWDIQLFCLTSVVNILLCELSD